MSERSTLAPEVATALSSIPVPTLTATMFAMGLKNTFLAGLAPLPGGAAAFVGTAYTMRALPTREDLLAASSDGTAPNLHRKAMAQVAAGEVIVTDCGATPGISFFGELIATFLAKKGVAAIVTDAGIADVGDVAATGLPVFCTGSAPIPGPSKRLVCDLQRPIDCMGVTVIPGDVLVGDTNGVAAIPFDRAAEVTQKAAEKEELERFLLDQLKAGAPLDGTYPPNEKMLAAYRASKGD